MQYCISRNEFKRIKWNLFWQPLCAVVFVALVLVALEAVSKVSILWAIGAGALASSSFLVFAIPKSLASEPNRVIGGYIVGIVSSLIVHAVLVIFINFATRHFAVTDPHIFWLSASIAVGLTMILMVFFGVHHPPAAGVSLVLVIDLDGHWALLFVILASAVVLASLRFLLRKRLKNLVE